MDGDLMDTPISHASTHASGQSDAVKIDDLAAADDNTDLNVSTSAHGLCPKLDNDDSHFLDGQGNWSEPAGGLTTIADSGSDAEVQDGNLIWANDSAADIGESADHRPNNVFAKGTITTSTYLKLRSDATGGFFEIRQAEQLVTINAAAYTDAAIACPVNCITLACASRVTVQPPGTSTFDLGINGNTTLFASGISTTASTVDPGTDGAATFHSSGQYVRITPNATPSNNTGRIRIHLFYISITPPSS
jgi:hypothetical protein